MSKKPLKFIFAVMCGKITIKLLRYEQINSSFKKIHIVKTRFDTMEIRNKKIISILTKGQNPVATSHCCNIVRENPTTKNIVLLG
ncbi:MAG: hypothetical protein J6A58_00195 [Oscillospiraceae bacterium]|nr:hypothetical protein [Oscillospiraceae bacterium]